MENIKETPGTLKIGEPHPCARFALYYIRSVPNITMVLESMSSCGIEGNRSAEVCAETLNRIMTGQPISDRYLMGLAWFLKEMEEENDTE